jgi:hypothetical protein
MRGPLFACHRPATSAMTRANVSRPTEKTHWLCLAEKPYGAAAS